jgi:hypothetical protein
MDAWLGALLDAPHLQVPTPEDPEAFLISARDNQVIKPRIFGTLEFRSAPARRAGRYVLALAALRLGVSAFALERSIHSSLRMSYPEACRRWWGIVDGAQCTSDTDGIVRIARIGLERRGKGEAELLDPFNKCVEDEQCA